jgi:hypothetical protein
MARLWPVPADLDREDLPPALDHEVHFAPAAPVADLAIPPAQDQVGGALQRLAAVRAPARCRLNSTLSLLSRAVDNPCGSSSPIGNPSAAEDPLWRRGGPGCIVPGFHAWKSPDARGLATTHGLADAGAQRDSPCAPASRSFPWS